MVCDSAGKADLGKAIENKIGGNHTLFRDNYAPICIFKPFGLLLLKYL